MVGPIVTVVGILVLGAGMLAAGFVLGMRSKSPLVIRPIVAFCKRWMNPAQLRTAGTPGAYAGIIGHRGRTSGRPYRTPVGVVAADDGFLIALPYGTSTQWLRNVLAAGTAELTVEGRTWTVDAPELITTASVMHHFGASDRRLFRALKTDHCLRLRQARELDAAIAA